MLTAVAFITPVFAQNTITFNGKIRSACTVQVNGSTDTTIDLGNYSKERIAEKGASQPTHAAIVSPASRPGS